MNVQVGRMLVIIAALCMILFMSVIWMIAVKLDNYSIVDIIWGVTFILTTVVVLVFTGNINVVSLTIAALVIIWGLRLSIYLFTRNAGKPEDYRYVDMRKKWGSKVKQTAFVRVFMLQGTVSLLFSLGIFLGISKSDTILSMWPVYAGVVVWIIGFLFEAVGDAQLRAFIQKPANKGRVITTGLWKYTRHPNYFGEATQWFGISIVACAVPFGWISFISPLLLTFFLMKISGVPLLEKKNSQKPGYAEYAAKTSVFVPMPPKN
jgi:steroid 5-alpha reductase family enzyme